MNLEQAKEFKNDFIKNHPEHEFSVNDFYQLMLDEIEAGESLENEVSLFIKSCNDLL